MEKTAEYIALLRQMSAILKSRRSTWTISEFQREKSERGIEALENAVEALQVQVYA